MQALDHVSRLGVGGFLFIVFRPLSDSIVSGVADHPLKLSADMSHKQSHRTI